MAILVGIAVAIWVTERRWRQRGGRAGVTYDLAAWAVPFGIVGARLYHLMTSPDAYFGAGGHPWRAFAIWQGGLGIWGAVAGGALGAWIAARRAGLLLPPFADATAVGLPLGQAIGRVGNYFNQELFGKPTNLPWGLSIDSQHRPNGYAQFATFHPTFAYESLWLLAVAGLVAYADRRWQLGHGRAFAVYIAAYVVGRAWIEQLRIDPAHTIAGVRLNVWTSLIVLVAAGIGFAISARRHPRREQPPLTLPGADKTPITASDEGVRA